MPAEKQLSSSSDSLSDDDDEEDEEEEWFVFFTARWDEDELLERSEVGEDDDIKSMHSAFSLPAPADELLLSSSD